MCKLKMQSYTYLCGWLEVANNSMGCPKGKPHCEENCFKIVAVSRF